MSFAINICSLTLGAFSGVTAYKQREVDYKLLGAFYLFVSPYQLVKVYTNMNIVQQIRFKNMNPAVIALTGLSCITVMNASIFGTGYVLGNSYARLE